MGTFIKTSTLNRSKVFTRKAANTDYPFPRPVQGNTVDFAMMYKGTHLFYGECKSVDNEGHDVLFFFTLPSSWH